MISETLAEHARVAPDREAIVRGAWRVTFRQLHDLVGARARACAAGEVVPLVDDDPCEFLISWLAALRAGGSPLALHAGAPQAEIRSALALGTPEEPEILLPTSGSTGEPRIARLSPEGVRWNASAHAVSVGLSPDDRLLVVGSPAHSAVLVAQVVAALQLGATLVLAPRPFTVGGFLEAAQAERVTATALTPVHAAWLLDVRARAQVAGADLSGLRIVTVGSAPIDPARLIALAGAFPAARIFATYGLTEAGPRVTTLCPEDFPDHADSVGLPLAGVDVRVVDPGTGAPIGRGAEGELEVRSPSRMRGYLGEPPCATDWLRTGDLAALDPAGHVRLRGRLKDIIISGGSKIAPREVERALSQDGRVRECAVVAESHDVLGEVVKAYVVPAAPVEASDLLDALAARLSPHKLPRRLVLVDALPYTASGKVDRMRLEAHRPRSG